MFQIKFNPENGGVDSLVLPEDTAAMNWLHGEGHTFGTVKGSEVVSVNPTENGMDAVYKTRNLLITVHRRMEEDGYKETYIFENTLENDAFFGRGDVGIYTPFYDVYTTAGDCMKARCHAHIWCGGNTSYIMAEKMGPYPYGVGLVLTEGSLDAYSLENCCLAGGTAGGHDSPRGDIVLHPTPFELCPGEKMTLSFTLFRYRDGMFYETLATYPTAILIKAENYTVFTDEKIRFSVNRADASVTVDGTSVPTETKGKETFVTFSPERTGHHVFAISAGGVSTKAEFFVQIPFKELAKRRAQFIVRHQQYHKKGSALDGAYLIYDGEDRRMFFDSLFWDRNACRERLVMGLFVARYLQYDRDPEIYESLMQYYRFVSREFYDEETGEVYNGLAKDPRFKRLYNAPWMSLFTMEMYRLTGDGSYLDKMYKLLSVYYSIGGEKFYPNGLSMYETVMALREAGKTDKADALQAMYRVHAKNIAEIGTNYPEHEVSYEQTIVSPAVALTAQMYMLEKDPVLLASCREHVKVLERFNGEQPSHYLNQAAIRFWDAYWFGKKQVYGDTFPHTASVHSSDAFLHYYWISGDEKYKEMAIRGARNNLSLFREDGSASCTRMYPLYSNGVRGEYNDVFANEQDGFLYFMIKFFGMMEGKNPKNPLESEKTKR